MDDFVGRVKEIQDICNSLFSQSTLTRALIICGLRAVGKSSLVRQICNRIQDFKVEWVDLRKVTEATRILEPLALSVLKERLDLFHSADAETMFNGLLYRLCTAFDNSPHKHLIVFDNIEDLVEGELLSDYMTKVLCSFVDLTNVRVIATSTTKTEISHPCVSEVLLEPLSLKDSQTLLSELCPSLRKDDKFYKIVDLCEGLPLVLQMTAAEIDTGELTVDEIVYLLSQCRLKLLSQEFYPSTQRLG